MFKVYASSSDCSQPQWFSTRNLNWNEYRADISRGYFSAGDLYPIEHPDNSPEVLKAIEDDRAMYTLHYRPGGLLDRLYLVNRWKTLDKANWQKAFNTNAPENFDICTIGELADKRRALNV